MNIALLEGLGIPDSVLNGYAEKLRLAGHNFAAYPRDTDEAVQMERAKDADIIIIANMPLSGNVIRGCPNLKFIDVAFTGVDHVDLESARERGICVSNAAGYSTQAVAELTVCFMLDLLRNVRQTEERCRNGGTKDGLVGCELGSRTVGIVGAGAIGMRTAMLCAAFGAKVLAYRRNVPAVVPEYVRFVPLEELLMQSDIVSLHCPLTDDTRSLISAERLALMKKGSFLINTARGPVVDPAALAEALNSGHLAGAAVDVFETEPPLDPSHCLLHSKNTIATPHIAFASAESMLARARIVFDNIDAWLKGSQRNIIL